MSRTLLSPTEKAARRRETCKRSRIKTRSHHAAYMKAWRADNPGYSTLQMRENRYEKKALARFWKKVNKDGPTARKEMGPCWVWTAKLAFFGYGGFSYRYETCLAHRISWMIHFGDLTSDQFVLHKCDVPKCVNPDHLFLGTQLENMRDRNSKGRANLAFGEALPQATLNVEKVKTIKIMRSEGRTQRSIAELFGVSQSLIAKITKGRLWKCVP